MKVGDSVTLENGLKIAVTEAEEVQEAYGDGAQMRITVSYKNTGGDTRSYNLLDRKPENKDRGRTQHRDVFWRQQFA